MEDLFASLRKTTSLAKIKRPISTLPKVWFGFLFAAFFLCMRSKWEHITIQRDFLYY